MPLDWRPLRGLPEASAYGSHTDNRFCDTYFCASPKRVYCYQFLACIGDFQQQHVQGGNLQVSTITARSDLASYIADALKYPVRIALSLRKARRKLDKGKCPRHNGPLPVDKCRFGLGSYGWVSIFEHVAKCLPC